MAPEHARTGNEGRRPDDWNGLLVAGLTLVTVLIMCYMCVQLFKARRPPPLCSPPGQKNGFAACSDGGGRSPYYAWWREMRGVTSGRMPSIDGPAAVSWAPCCGALGVPPPALT
jgi:hypothetical protein